MSGTGTIHDIASEHFDREIKFPKGHEYALVLASYYGGGGLYYTAKTPKGLLRLLDRHGEFSHVIMDSDGDYIDVDWLRNQAGE